MSDGHFLTGLDLGDSYNSTQGSGVVLGQIGFLENYKGEWDVWTGDIT
jgi:hypothetical protein